MPMGDQANDLERQLWALQPGDHLFCLLESEAELMAVAAPFVRHGLDRSEKVLLCLAPETRGWIQGRLRDSGLDLDPSLLSGQVRLSDGTGPGGPCFPAAPEAMIDHLAAEAHTAVREGYTALRVAVEMGCLLNPGEDAGALHAYDARLNAFLEENRCIALCLMDRRRLSPEILMEVLPTHSRILLGNDILDNHFYLAPDEIGGRDAASAALANWLGNLKAQKLLDQRIRLLTEALFKAQENERRMISRELHDRVAQDLSTMKIILGTLFDETRELPPLLRPRMTQLSGLLDRTINAVRDLAYDMRPPGLDDFGIVQALAMYCGDFGEKTGLPVDFHAAGVGRVTMDDTTQINLYRMVQEGLNNIRKHAGASRATVKMVAAHPYILLRIEDDGLGFDVKKRAAEIDGQKRMGLRSLQERAKLLGGAMVVKSEPGRGTKIFIKCPIKGAGA